MIEIEQDRRPSCEDLMKNSKICFFIRALRLREMESNVKRKEEEVKIRNEAFKLKEIEMNNMQLQNKCFNQNESLQRIKGNKEEINKL